MKSRPKQGPGDGSLGSVVNARLVVPEIGVMSGGFSIRDGRIHDLWPGERTDSGAGPVLDAGGRYVLPGVIDPHLHGGLLPPFGPRLRRESGHAASGGVTTAIHYVRRVDSYLDSLPRYLDVASRNQLQDYAVHLTMFRNEQTRQMEACVREYGVTSFKVYMMLRGALGRGLVMDQVAEDAPLETADVDFDNGHLYDVFRTASTLPARLRINVHSEDADIVASEMKRIRELGWDGLPAWHAARPGHSEAIAIQTVGYLAQQFDVPAYFPHIGSRQGIDALTELRKKGVSFVAETCPQYVALTIESKAGNLAKITPPVRTEEDVARVWAAIAGETITTFGSDHISYTDSEKQLGPVWTTRAAFGGTGLILPILLTRGVAEGRLTIHQVARMTSYASARAFGLYPRKGTLLPGADADFVVLDADDEWSVNNAELGSASDFSVYEHMSLKGRVALTVLRGSAIYRDGEVTGRPGVGRYYRRFPSLESMPAAG